MRACVCARRTNLENTIIKNKRCRLSPVSSSPCVNECLHRLHVRQTALFFLNRSLFFFLSSIVSPPCSVRSHSFHLSESQDFFFYMCASRCRVSCGEDYSYFSVLFSLGRKRQYESGAINEEETTKDTQKETKRERMLLKASGKRQFAG
jgi:uncharacterized protein YlaI